MSRKVNGPHISLEDTDNLTLSPFLANLWHMVNNNDIIHWNIDGDAFLIDNMEEFESRLLPLYFKHNKFSSFVRQLNMYKFVKHGHSTYSQWSHPNFVRGQVNLLNDIRRKTQESKIKDRTSSPQPEETTSNYQSNNTNTNISSNFQPIPSTSSVPVTSYISLQLQLSNLIDNQRAQQKKISELEAKREVIQQELDQGKQAQENMQNQLAQSVKHVTSLLAVLLAKNGLQDNPAVKEIQREVPVTPTISYANMSGDFELGSNKKRHHFEDRASLPTQLRKLNDL